MSPKEIPTTPKAATTSVTIYSIPRPSGNVSVNDKAKLPIIIKNIADVK